MTRIDAVAICEELSAARMTDTMIASACGVSVRVVAGWRKGVRPTRRQADMLQALARTNRLFADHDSRLCYEWWWSQSDSLDHQRPLDVHPEEPKRVRVAAERFLQRRSS